jgi:hypothetical protein
MDKLQEAIKRTQVPGYYGHLEIDINDGEIAVIRETKTTKLTTRRGSPRNDQQDYK